ncbi:Hcp family type VI secretion system effector [Pseudomonas brassicacearum]|uniref:Hcp family type VI secretion system effector n=1 Tax=Pseudomonas brassicacearum TaxID=930166 RepID=A0AAJ3KVD3_9PSED|nr:Hcp family type VI secretion system effector [Pseudomonas brassicacearum]NUT81334.1 Hcp family type VI secretion system effector [Pseudomonas brassicacearum]QGA50461.1 Hcp family type VI secretion system effector [Pseudomonas brassicacearum]
MANHSYMTISGSQQGLISAGCSTQDSIGNKCQAGHEDEIMVLAYSHNMTAGDEGSIMGGRGKHMPIVLTKNIDKSTPLLASALHEGEEIECKINFYRTSPAGFDEKYFTVMLSGGRIANISVQVPHAIHMSDAQPQELIAIRYREISWAHHQAGTSAYSSWGNKDE